MSDRIFSGKDIDDALKEAERGLGLPAETLRYVVLEKGSTGALGMGATPAQIAVLLDFSRRTTTSPFSDPSVNEIEEDPRAKIQEGCREQRDEALRVEAQRLAAAVRSDGTPRLTASLNSYERRLVHIALAQEGDIQTYSVGEEGARRVTIALLGRQVVEESALL